MKTLEDLMLKKSFWYCYYWKFIYKMEDLLNVSLTKLTRDATRLSNELEIARKRKLSVC